MDKYEVYKLLKTRLSSYYIFEKAKEIDFGIQFFVYHPGCRDLVRIYESKKKGITIDFSQVRDDYLKKVLSQICLIEETREFTSNYTDKKLQEAFLDYKSKLLSENLEIIDFNKINYGIQFKVKFNNKEQETVRIYNGKRGINFDLSLVEKEEHFDILHYLTLKRGYIKKGSTTSTKPIKKNVDTKTKEIKNNTDIKVNTTKKKDEKKTKKQLRKEIKQAKAQKPLLDALADKIIDYTKKYGMVSILRYDSKVSESIYLKFDYGMAGSLRISAHESKKDLKYTFNILKGLTEPRKESSYTDQGKPCDRYFYPFEMAGNAARDILRYRSYRVEKYSYEKYVQCMQEHKKDVGVRKGFWSKATEV